MVAAEILACEEERIENALLEHPDFVKFFDFFKAKRVNILLSNVVIKVLDTLLETQTEKVPSMCPKRTDRKKGDGNSYL